MAVDQQDLLKPKVIIGLIKKWRWLIIVPIFVAIAVGIILAIKLPKVYEASTLILIQSQKVPTEFVQSLITEDVDERITTLQQQTLSRTNLEKIIHELNLFNYAEDDGMFMEDKVNALRKNINIQTTRSHSRRGGATSAFKISFRGEEPKIVMEITNALASSFISENLRVREAQATGTSDFLESELNAMRIRLEVKESEIEKFRTRFMGELPEQLDTNLSFLDRLQMEVISRRESLRDAQTRLSTMQSQATTGLPQTGAPAGTADHEIDPLDIGALRAEFARLQTRYTDQHPDVIKLRIQIEGLERSGTQAEADSEIRSVPREPAQISAIRNEINGLNADITRIEAQIREHEARVEAIPKREQELTALERDYQDLQTSYSSLLNRKIEAEMAVNMERNQKGEQFQIIDRAQVPSRPIKPNMQILLLMTVAAGFGLGGGLVFLMEFFNHSFQMPKDIDQILQLPTLTVIPIIENKLSRIIRIANNVGTVIALGATCTLLAVFVSITLLGVESTLTIFQAGKNAVF